MRWKLQISYDGTNFSGYQVQPNKRTIQQEIETVLARMHKGEHISITASGRTDAGVHAIGQVIHFDSPLQIEPDRWIQSLNSQLPLDIRVMTVEAVEEDFHARFHTTSKTYRYKWYIGEQESPFKRLYTVHAKKKMNVENMRIAARFLVGTYDFSSFCAANTSVVNKVRTIYEIEFVQHDDELHMIISGDGFLYNMVRIIAGLLSEVGNGKRRVEEVLEILEAKDRTKNAKTAPAHGLYLEKVMYK